MKKKYTYKVCHSCKQEKKDNRSPYCLQCQRIYTTKWRQKRRDQKEQGRINLKGLGEFIKSTQYMNFKTYSTLTLFTLKDMFVTIIFFYEIITNDIGEFDTFPDGTEMPAGVQIQKMWEKILNYYIKEKRKERLR